MIDEMINNVSLLMGCACVWEDNPRALASGLSPDVHGKIIHKLQRVGYRPYRRKYLTIICLMHQYAFALCALLDS